MNMTMCKSDVFTKEYGYIKNPKYIENIKILVNLLPDYFFEVAASSTGKYHPAFALGEGGLVRHTKVAAYMAHELLNDDSIGNIFTDDEKDLMIMALLVHDGLKHGKEKAEYVVFDHPVIIANYIKENKDKLTLTEGEIGILTNMIESHMGPWNNNKYSQVILPKPGNRYQKFVHMCDYLASRKVLNINFDENDIVE